MQTTPSYKKRNCTLFDPSTSNRIEIKFWNQESDLITPDNEDASGQVENVVVNTFNGKNQLNSTGQTNVMVNIFKIFLINLFMSWMLS